ncbi:MAG: hypothetical protein IKQ97_03380 [Eubacterium sp.]|nr:hypothetical protein [Eubacterium sp.]
MKSWVKSIIIIVIPVCFAVLLAIASTKIGNRQENESLKQLENSVRKAVMTCYATEGVYPPSVDYIEDHYGIQIDHDRYGVFYEVFGDNVMPQITVMEKNAEEEG